MAVTGHGSKLYQLSRFPFDSRSALSASSHPVNIINIFRSNIFGRIRKNASLKLKLPFLFILQDSKETISYLVISLSFRHHYHFSQALARQSQTRILTNKT
jgi:hypothetical protein